MNQQKQAMFIHSHTLFMKFWLMKFLFKIWRIINNYSEKYYCVIHLKYKFWYKKFLYLFWKYKFFEGWSIDVYRLVLHLLILLNKCSIMNSPRLLPMQPSSWLAIFYSSSSSFPTFSFSYSSYLMIS